MITKILQLFLPEFFSYFDFYIQKTMSLKSIVLVVI